MHERRPSDMFLFGGVICYIVFLLIYVKIGMLSVDFKLLKLLG